MSDLVGQMDVRSVRLKAEATLPAINRVVIKGTADNQCKAPGGADVEHIGVAQETPDAAGDWMDVAVNGVVQIVANAAITKWKLVSIAGTGGRVKIAAPGSGANSFIVGLALEAAAAQGDLIRVYLIKSVMQGA